MYPEEIRIVLAIKLQNQLNPTARRFFSNPEDKTEEAKRKALVHTLNVCERYHRMQEEVGWIAILLSHAWSSDVVNRASYAQFNNFMRALLNIRPHIMKVLGTIWPSHPRILLMTGGTSCLSTSSDLS